MPGPVPVSSASASESDDVEDLNNLLEGPYHPDKDLTVIDSTLNDDPRERSARRPERRGHTKGENQVTDWSRRSSIGSEHEPEEAGLEDEEILQYANEEKGKEKRNRDRSKKSVAGESVRKVPKSALSRLAMKRWPWSYLHFPKRRISKTGILPVRSFLAFRRGCSAAACI
jgi:hypothetical protein